MKPRLRLHVRHRPYGPTWAVSREQTIAGKPYRYRTPYNGTVRGAFRHASFGMFTVRMATVRRAT